MRRWPATLGRADTISDVALTAAATGLQLGDFTMPSIDGDGANGRARWYAVFLEASDSGDDDMLVDIGLVTVADNFRPAAARPSTDITGTDRPIITIS